MFNMTAMERSILAELSEGLSNSGETIIGHLSFLSSMIERRSHRAAPKGAMAEKAVPFSKLRLSIKTRSRHALLFQWLAVSRALRTVAPVTGSADGSTFQCGSAAFSSSGAVR